MTARRALAGVLAGVLAALVGGAHASDPGLVDFDSAEIRRILQHGPWPPPVPRDPSNRASGDPRAVAFGQRLFFDGRLSATGAVACASCHVPARGWTDGRPRAIGLDRLDRNTPTVLNAGLQRWFSWEGSSDSLWAQSLKPIVDPREMGAGAGHVAALVRADPGLACLYRAVFGSAGDPDERVLVNVGKALAAFLETVNSGRTSFDDFRDALARGDRSGAGRYPQSAQRGLRIFVGKGNCHVCHVGPTFTNGEFHDVGVPFLLGPGRVDSGRHGGIKQLGGDRFNLLGPYSDDASGTAAVKTRHVELQHANYGQFKTPSLRSAALTAPYMHDGRFATLRDVVRHYSTLDLERLHTHGEQLLRPLHLAEAEVGDLVAFLESLTDVSPPRALPSAQVAGCAP